MMKKKEKTTAMLLACVCPPYILFVCAFCHVILSTYIVGLTLKTQRNAMTFWYLVPLINVCILISSPYYTLDSGLLLHYHSSSGASGMMMCVWVYQPRPHGRKIKNQELFRVVFQPFIFRGRGKYFTCLLLPLLCGTARGGLLDALLLF